MGSFLVVDDEKSIRITVKQFLADHGYDVVTAVNVTDAIQMLDKSDFDVVISDII